MKDLFLLVADKNARFTLEGALNRPKSLGIRPKEALEAALSRIKLPRSSAIYRRIADRASMRRCTDPAFHRFRLALASWFPAQPESEPGL